MPVGYNIAANTYLPDPLTTTRGKALRSNIKSQELSREMAPIVEARQQQQADAQMQKGLKGLREESRELSAEQREQRKEVWLAGKLEEERGGDASASTKAMRIKAKEVGGDLPKGFKYDGSSANAILLYEEEEKKLQQADYIDAGGAARQGAFDPATGQYSAGGESPIAPQATQSDLGGLTPAGLNQVTIDYRKKVGFAATGAASATELVKISYKDPAGLGKSGALVSFGNEIAATAKNLVALAGQPPLPAEATQKQASGSEGDWDWSVLDKETKKLGMAPEAAARFKSGIYSIAFSAAVGEQGSRPSDKDIQWYIDIYGGGITDAKVFRGTIATAMRRQYNMLKFTAALNPEIQDSAASLAIFEKPYNEFLAALEGKKKTDAAYDPDLLNYMTPEQRKLFE